TLRGTPGCRRCRKRMPFRDQQVALWARVEALRRELATAEAALERCVAPAPIVAPGRRRLLRLRRSAAVAMREARLGSWHALAIRRALLVRGAPASGATGGPPARALERGGPRGPRGWPGLERGGWPPPCRATLELDPVSSRAAGAPAPGSPPPAGR